MEKEFVFQGHEIVEENPDIIYDNNGFFENAIEYSKKYPKAKKIFNLLDIPPHNPTWPFKQAKEQLLQADVITTISETVRAQIKDLLELESRVIYHPIRPSIKWLKYLKTIDFTFVGRCNDPNKRFNLIKPTLELLGYNTDFLVVSGTEPPPIGTYAGIMLDEDLNELYNSTKYVFLLSKYEGIGLPAMEGIICGAMPLLCNDNKAAYEFGLERFAVNPNPTEIAKKIVDIQNNPEPYLKKIEELRPKFVEMFSVSSVVKNITSLF